MKILKHFRKISKVRLVKLGEKVGKFTNIALYRAFLGISPIFHYMFQNS